MPSPPVSVNTTVALGTAFLNEPLLLKLVGVIGCGYLLYMMNAIMRAGEKTFPTIGANSDFGTVKGVGNMMFTNYLLPFELTSVLLLAAVVGAVILAKRKI